MCYTEDMKKKISQKKKNIIGENDQFGVILEDINSKFDLIMESFDGMNRKIDKNHEEFLEFKEDMTEFRKDMVEFKSDMTEFKSDMTGFKKESESKFDTILSYLMSIDEELKEIKMELEILKKSEKYQNEEIRLLEIRIKKLEKDNVKLHKLLIKAN